jgi:hypothetical protein
VQLAELQRAFLRRIFDRSRTAVEACVLPGALTAGKRLEIYRNNVFSNYISALTAVYPVILRLVGEEFFHHAAREFIVDYPSASGDIHHFGREFDRFVADFSGAAQLPYLPGVAKLEWAVHEVFHAEHHAGLDFAKLQSLAPSDYGSLLFKLHPAVRLIESTYPIRKIWLVNQPDYADELAVDLGEGGDTLLVIRREFEVEIEPMEAGRFALLRALARGEPFAAAVERTMETFPDLEVSASLAACVQARAIVDFELRRPSKSPAI